MSVLVSYGGCRVWLVSYGGCGVLPGKVRWSKSLVVPREKEEGRLFGEGVKYEVR